MGELMEQILAGGPAEMPLADLPRVRALMETPGVRWELNRMQEHLRDRLSRLDLVPAVYSALYFYAEISTIIRGPLGSPLSENEARNVVSFLAGEWINASVAAAFRDTVRAHREWTKNHAAKYRIAAEALAAEALAAAIPEVADA